MAVQRMKQTGLKGAWGVWAHLSLHERRMTVAETRIIAKMTHGKLAAAMETWKDLLRAARRDARAKAFAVALVGRRSVSVLKWWSTVMNSAKWTEQVLLARTSLAELRGKSKTQLLVSAIRTWDNFKEQEAENACNGSPQDSPNKTKFVSY